jgi:hypothetical protein
LQGLTSGARFHFPNTDFRLLRLLMVQMEQEESSSKMVPR